MEDSGARLRFVVAVALVLGGCVHAGPRVIRHDSFDYTKSIGDTRETQALQNLVRLRYAEFPVFLDLTQVVANYTLLQQLVVSGLNRMPEPEDKYDEAKGVYTVQFEERPSMVYLPVEGTDLVAKMLTPTRPSVVLALIQTGWGADWLLEAMAQSVNGSRNRGIQGVVVSEPDPEFSRFVEVLREVQLAGGLAVVFDTPAPDQVAEHNRMVTEAALAGTKAARAAAMAAIPPAPVDIRLCFREERLDERARESLDRVRQDLGLEPDLACYTVVAADAAPDGGTVAFQMRSLLQLMMELAAYVDVPHADLASGAAPTLARTEAIEGAHSQPPLRIQSGPVKPDSAFAAIHYAGSWFWIDNTDLRSKGTFMYLMLLLSVTESGGSAAQLVVSTN